MTPDTHDARVREALALGADPNGAARLAEMARGDVSERWRAVLATHYSRDAGLLLRMLHDPSRRVRGKALVMLALVGDDESVVRGLRIAHAMHASKVLVERLLRRRRQAPIDRFVDWLVEQQDLRSAIDLLALGSEDGVRRHLDMALSRPSWLFWRRLGGRHPQVLAEVLLARWRAVEGEADPVTRMLTSQHHARIAERDPAAGLALYALLLRRGIQSSAPVQRSLMQREPDAMLRLHLDVDVRPFGLSSRARERVSVATYEAVLRRQPGWLDWQGVTATLSSPDRRRLSAVWLEVADQPRLLPAFAETLPDGDHTARFDAWSRAVRNADGIVRPALLEGLPLALREREARRHLDEVVALRPHPSRRARGYARHLPWDDCRRACAVLLGHPDATERQTALGELLSLPAARDDAAHVADCLALVTARKFEQDPVRSTMIGVLASWPMSLWDRSHLPTVAQVLRDALDAADLSGGTARAAETLVLRLLPLDPDWATAWLFTLVKERGVLYDAAVGKHLDADTFGAARPHLLRVARAWCTRERLRELYALCASLGALLAEAPELAEVLADARDRGTTRLSPQFMALLSDHFPSRYDADLPGVLQRWSKRRFLTLHLARHEGAWRPAVQTAVEQLALVPGQEQGHALSILHDQAREAFAALLPAVLERDPSVIRLPHVCGYVHRRRTDLLTPYLGGEPVRGYHASGRTAWVLPFRDGFHRWTASQNQLYADQLLSVVADRERDTPTVLDAIARLPHLLYADLTGLKALADDDRPVVRERAIRVLARCDAGQGLPTLIRCLGDARARFAIYGLRRALLSMPPLQALAVLEDAPLRKVTIAKEVVRLLGEVRCEPAYARLVALSQTDLHRDVFLALLRALWDHLHREPTWAVFERAIAAEDWVIANRVGFVPANRLTADADRRLSALMARVVQRPEPEARLALLQASHLLGLSDPDGVFLSAIRERLESPYADEVRAATRALLNRQDEDQIEAFRHRIASLSPRSLQVFAADLTQFPLAMRDSWLVAGRALLEHLEFDPRHVPLAVSLATKLLDCREQLAFVLRLGSEGRLDHDVLTALHAMVTTRPRAGRWTATRLRRLLSGPPGCRRVALWVLHEVLVRDTGWTAEHLAALKALRGDADPWISGAASRVLPPAEDEVETRGH